jgi:hypothetical protein
MIIPVRRLGEVLNEKIDGKTVLVHRMFWGRFCNFELAVGTNCPNGGDTGHGGRTVLRMSDQGGTDMRVNGTPANTVEIVFGGDDEHLALTALLEFALAVLRGESTTRFLVEQLEIELEGAREELAFEQRVRENDGLQDSTVRPPA